MSYSIFVYNIRYKNIHEYYRYVGTNIYYRDTAARGQLPFHHIIISYHYDMHHITKKKKYLTM